MLLISGGVDRPIVDASRRGARDRPGVDQPSARTAGFRRDRWSAAISGHLERQIEALAGVEPRVAHRLVAIVELAVEDLVGAADALGDVVAGEARRGYRRARCLGP